jgi:TPR repeat protein
LHVIGSLPDPAQARAWYQRAAEIGSAEAGRRLEPLAKGAR